MALEIRLVGPEWFSALAEFFATIQSSGEKLFHPHPFTDEWARIIAEYSGKDLYYLLVNQRRALAYGILRGWDEGYDVPSLGIAVHPNARGRGLGLLMMHFLHGAARYRGAKRIRLKVYPENSFARDLYLKLGYRLDERNEEGQLIGILEL